MLIHPSMIPVYNWYWYLDEFSDMTNQEREANLAMMLGQTVLINAVSIVKTGVPASSLRTFMRVLNYVFHTPGRPSLMTTIKPMIGPTVGTIGVAIAMDALTTPGADYSRGPYGAVKIVPRLGW